MTKKSKTIQIAAGGGVLALLAAFAVFYEKVPAFRGPWVSGACFLLIAFLILGLNILLKWKVDKRAALFSRIVYIGLLLIFLIGIIRGLTGI